MSTSSAFFAGMYLGASGDTRIIERQNRQIQKTDTIQEAWNGTGKALQAAMNATPTTRNSSPTRTR